MKNKIIVITKFVLIIALFSVCTGCKGKNINDADDMKIENETGYTQTKLKESKILTIPEDGILEVEVDSLAKPDGTEVEELPVFLAINLKEDTDIGMQYTYDTYGKEGIVFCCDVNDSDIDETELKSTYSMCLAQSSEEDYGEIWQSSGTLLRKGTNLFYFNGSEQTLPYRMLLKMSFSEPQKIESVVLYPIED